MSKAMRAFYKASTGAAGTTATATAAASHMVQDDHSPCLSIRTLGLRLHHWRSLKQNPASGAGSGEEANDGHRTPSAHHVDGLVRDKTTTAPGRNETIQESFCHRFLQSVMEIHVLIIKFSRGRSCSTAGRGRQAMEAGYFLHVRNFSP